MSEFSVSVCPVYSVYYTCVCGRTGNRDQQHPSAIWIHVSKMKCHKLHFFVCCDVCRAVSEEIRLMCENSPNLCTKW